MERDEGGREKGRERERERKVFFGGCKNPRLG